MCSFCSFLLSFVPELYLEKYSIYEQKHLFSLSSYDLDSILIWFDLLVLKEELAKTFK